jgi:hypothetical protein
MALFAGGAAMGVVGILRDGEGWWVPSAIGLLALGMLVGMVQGVRERRRARAEDDEE